jgi:hypothetical protein
MSFVKAKKVYIVWLWFVLLSIGLLSLTSCCSSHGTGKLYVSHPQIHTRERLVEQRHREQEWLENQLKVANDIKTTYQGLRDFREFVGFYNELAVSLNPTQGKLDQLTNDAQAAGLRAQLWKQRTAELDAYRSYIAALKSDNKTTSGNPETSTNTKAENNTAQPPSPSTPYGTTPKDITLPNPKDLVKTQAEAHPLDLFYDRLAYRNAVNAALKSNQLDDSHDFAGHMLYELTLSISLTPGNRSQQFAQVELKLIPEKLRARIPGLVQLYDNWVKDLQTIMVGDIFELQRRVTEKKLTEYDQKYLRWFVDRSGPALLLRMEKASGELYDEKTKDPKVIDDIKNRSWTARFELLSKHRGETKAETVLEMMRNQVEFKKYKEIYSFGPNEVKDLEELLRALHDPKLSGIFSTQCSDDSKCALLRKTAGWAVWGAYFDQLEKLVGIKAPLFDGEGYLDFTDGLKVTKREAYYDYKPLIDDEERELMAILKDEYKLVFPSTDVSREESSRPSDTGLATFVKRIYRAEQEMYAATVQPKEQAQNISEASARDTMLNLALALSAMLPNSGVNATNKSQYVKRAQTYLHAITRQPLLVGYGDGEQRFGWFLGPAFRVEDGKADFVHRVIRHDVSAGIVIPAWWNYLRLCGKQFWIGADGQPTNEIALWDDRPILLNVRIPANASKYITSALLAHSMAEEPSFATARPYPVIEYPDPNKKEVIRVQSVHSTDLVLPTQKDALSQDVLVLGRNLWRNPQVFLGPIKADSVEVLSNMEGVLATFFRMPYPGTLTGPMSRQPVPVDLTVITSFGSVRCKEAVEILPPIDLPVAEPAPLLRPYVDDVDKTLAFRLNRPAAYGAIKLFLKSADDTLSNFKLETVQAKWTDDNKYVYFEVGPLGDPKKASRLWVADLRLYPSDTDVGAISLTKKGGQEFAWFVNKAERSLTLDVSSIEYDKDGKAKFGFELTFHQNWLKALYVAYPGLSDAIASGKAVARLSLGNESVAAVRLSASDSSSKSKPQKLQVSKDILSEESLRKKLLSDKYKGKDLDVSLGYSDDESVTIPVLASDGKPAKINFTQ